MCDFKALFSVFQIARKLLTYVKEHLFWPSPSFGFEIGQLLIIKDKLFLIILHITLSRGHKTETIHFTEPADELLLAWSKRKILPIILLFLKTRELKDLACVFKSEPR